MNHSREALGPGEEIKKCGSECAAPASVATDRQGEVIPLLGRKKASIDLSSGYLVFCNPSAGLNTSSLR